MLQSFQASGEFNGLAARTRFDYIGICDAFFIPHLCKMGLAHFSQLAPAMTRVAVLRDTSTTTGVGQFAAIQAVASSFAVELSPLDVQDASEIERSIGAFAGSAQGGLIVTSSPNAIINRELIIALAARHRLPAVYPFRLFVTAGGLVSYGPDLLDPHRRTAGYVDRILKGEKLAELPVQTPTKYETLINLKTATALGLTVPPGLLATADEVIE